MGQDTIDQLMAGITSVTWQSLVMIAIGGLLILLAIWKEYEPLLLLPIHPMNHREPFFHLMD